MREQTRMTFVNFFLMARADSFVISSHSDLSRIMLELAMGFRVRDCLGAYGIVGRVDLRSRVGK